MQKLKFVTKEQRDSGSSCCGPEQGAGAASSRDAARSILSCPTTNRNAPRWTTGTVPTPSGAVPQISTVWTRSDYWGMLKSRSGGYRMRYTVAPGLYAVGAPDRDSDVLVTANYKLSFDIVRRALTGFNAWVLVLDTKSINVWCAAGKGTFSTDELAKRMTEARLDAVVSHRRVIVPQLGAVGVNAAEIVKRTGFRVSFGPVEARDIPEYIRAGYKKTKAMSAMKFTMLDRLVLTPMEINPAMKKFPWVAAGILLIFGLQPSGLLFKEAWSNGLPFQLLGLLSVLTGALVTPVLLPFIPFRSFAVKGWITGVLSVFIATRYLGLSGVQDPILLAVAYLLFPALSSYIALQFTGSTTFTGMSGVKKELKIGIPLYIGAASVSLILMVVFKLREWSVI
ncbi:MAG: mercury methylation corrinoid protein HgcA [Nitrospirota bacterium]